MGVKEREMSKGIPPPTPTPTPPLPLDFFLLYSSTVLYSKREKCGHVKNCMAIAGCCFLGNVTKGKQPSIFSYCIKAPSSHHYYLLSIPKSERHIRAIDKPSRKMRRPNCLDMPIYLEWPEQYTLHSTQQS